MDVVVFREGVGNCFDVIWVVGDNVDGWVFKVVEGVDGGVSSVVWFDYYVGVWVGFGVRGDIGLLERKDYVYLVGVIFVENGFVIVFWGDGDDGVYGFYGGCGVWYFV